MRSLLYPIHFIVKFGIILYDNELPRRQSNVGAHICEGAEGIPRSSIPEPAVLDCVKPEAPEVIAPEYVASVAVSDEVAFSNYVLFERAVARGKNVHFHYPSKLLRMSSGHAQQKIAERRTLVDSSTQEHAAGSSGDSPLWEAQIGTKSTAEASTETNEDIVVNDFSIHNLASPSTLVNTPTEYASAADSEDNERRKEAEYDGGLLEEQNEEDQMQDEKKGDTYVAQLEEETMEGLQDTTGVASTAMVDEALRNELAAHQRTREELAQLREQITTKDTQIQTASDKYLRLLRRSNDSHRELEEERDDLLEEREEAKSRISELEESDGDNVRRLESKVEYLENAAQRMWGKITDQNNIIRVGYKHLSFYIRLGTKLHARLDRVDRILESSRWTPSSVRAEIGSADRLMRLVEKWLPIAVPAKKHSRKKQLAIEGPPADTPETAFGHEEGKFDNYTKRPVSDICDTQEGEAGDNGQVADVEAEESALNTFNFSNVRHEASHTASSNTSESTSTESGFAFSPTSPAQETQQKIEDTAKKPMFVFGGIPAQDPRPKAKCRAKDPLAPYAATPAQETLQHVPSRVTASAHIFTLPQQTAPPDVQTADHKSKAKVEWDEAEDQTEGPTKKSRTTSIREVATSVVEFGSSYSDTKEKISNKTSRNTSICDTAASINLSTPSAGSEEEATKRASILDEAATVNLCPLSSGNKIALGASLVHDHRRTPETPKNIYTPRFYFSETTTKGEEPAPRTASPPMFGVGGTPSQFAFSASGIMPNFGEFNSNRVDVCNTVSDPKIGVVGGEERQNQESTKEAMTPSSTTQAFPKFDSPASGEKASFDQSRFGTASASEVQSIERSYNAPAKEPAKAGHVETGLTSAIESAATTQTEVVSSESTQVSFSTAQTQVQGLTANFGSSQSVQSSPVSPSGIQDEGDHQLSDDQRREKNNKSELREATSIFSAKASRRNSKAPSTSEGGMEGEAPGVLGKASFDVAALTRIVTSIPPAVLEKSGVVDILNSPVSRGAKPASQIEDNKDERDISQGSGRAAAEAVASQEMGGGERAELVTKSVPWRDPEWPAALPPLEDPEPEWSAKLSSLATPLTTETTSRRTPTSSQASKSSLEPIEEGLRYVLAGIQSLQIGPAAPPVIYVEFDPDKHFLSGDWVARRYTLREVICGDKRPVEQRRAGRALVRGYETRVSSQPGTGREEESTTPAREAQEVLASCEQERLVEPEAVVESEPKRTDLAHASDDSVEMQLRLASQMTPQTRLQMEATATSETRASESIAEAGCESQEQTKDTTPKKPSKGLRIWSLKER